MMFGIGQKEDADRKLKNFEQLCETDNIIRTDIDYLSGLLELFDSFTGWDRFRKEYLVDVRLPKLYAAAAKALPADDAVRNQIAGQVFEAEFLSQTKETIAEKLRRLTLRQKEVQQKLMLHESRKIGSA